MDSSPREDLQRAAESLLVAASAWEACSEFALRPGLPDALGARRAHPARPLRRGAGPDRSAARRARPVRRRALVHVRVRGLHPLQRQPARRRRAALRAHRRPRLPARQPPPRRPGGVGHGGHRVPPARPADDAALDPHRRAHRARARPTTSSACRSSATSPTCSARSATSTAPQRYLAQAVERDSMFSGQVLVTKFILDARQRDRSATSTRPCSKAAPMGWWRVKLVAAYAMAVQRRHRRRHRHARRRSTASCSPSGSSTSSHSARVGIAAELDALLQRAPGDGVDGRGPPAPAARRRPPHRTGCGSP